MKETRRFASLTLPTLAQNLALDELLVVGAEEGDGGEILRLWEWQHLAVVLGAGGRLEEDVDVKQCQQDGVAILRRSSGGGTVLLGQGCLCYTLILDMELDPALRSIRGSYAWILERMCRAFQAFHPNIHPAGISDLAIGDRKCSGSAQQRKRRYLLHHGTLLFDFDLGKVSRYLRMPARRPDYRESRSHEAFLTNLPATSTAISEQLRATWQAEMSAASLPLERAARLAEEKYLKEEWIRRR